MALQEELAEGLFPDEDPDIRREAEKIFADADTWLSTPNDNLGGRTPNDLAAAGKDRAVRNLLRSIKYVGIS